MTDQQLELGFDGTRVARVCRRERRFSHGTWWFTHMRQIVDRAMEWPAAGGPRPEQVWLPVTERQVRV
jgi:hypothetical protein